VNITGVVDAADENGKKKIAKKLRVGESSSKGRKNERQS
jgi:hypothetical protein